MHKYYLPTDETINGSGLGEITYRDYREGDERQVASLLEMIFDSGHDLTRWNWEFKENPTVRIDIVLATIGSLIVGQSASIPLDFNHEGRTIKATRVQNVMVHPDFRRRGIFLETLRELTHKVHSKQVDFIITFPNDLSLNAFTERLGYKHVSDIFTFNMPVDLVIEKCDANLSLCIQSVIEFTQSDVAFINSQLREFNIFNSRNIHYLNWRYHRNSGRRYSIVRVFDGEELVGIAVCKIYHATMSIDLVEFIVRCDKSIIRHALSGIYGYFRNTGIKSFNIWSAEHYSGHQCLLDIGFSKTNLATHVVCKTLSANCSSLCETPTSYFLSMGDSDVY